MVVILRENIANLGRIGDIIKVPDGYARNYLLPRKLVAVADESNKAQIENQKKILEKKRLASKALSSELAERLAQVQVTVKRKVGENDKIFGSVTNADIAAELKGMGFQVERKWITLDHAIKALGTYVVNIKLDADVSTTLKVAVAQE